MSTILKLENVSFSFPDKSISGKNDWIPVFNNVSLSIKQGQIIGLVGKSGCGKTTLGKLLVNYFSLNNEDVKITGTINYYTDDAIHDITSKKYIKQYKIQPIQMIFQDPKISLNLKMKTYDQLKEAILTKNKLKGHALKNKIFSVAKQFKLDEKLNSTPGSMSGGERRRLGLAKIIATEPKIIIADEPVASLDVSIKYEIMKIILSLKNKGQTIVIISHDIALIRKEADVIFVMSDGEIVEQWLPVQDPNHRATKQLLKDSEEVNAPLKKLITISKA
jgi:ABC-type glutathione transport system ATPase component